MSNQQGGNLTLDQRRALMGAWYNIVGPAGGYGRGPYGGYYVGAEGGPMVAPQAPMPPMPMPPQAPAPRHHNGYGPAPRNWLVEQAGPDRAQREVLPMSTGVPILPTQSAQITGRPQAPAWRCERFVISNAGTAGGAADWIVNDIKIGNRSQFVQSGDVPGDMFATNAIDTFVSFETAQTAMDVVVVVTYIGQNESGVPFYASMVGTAAL
jgi:hypothetical protein